MKPVPAVILLGLAIALLTGFAVSRGLWVQPVYVSVMLTIVLLWLSWIDLTEMRLPDYLTIPMIVAGLAWSSFVTHQPMSAVIGAVTGYALIWALGTYWQQARGQQGIGLGDAKLLAAAGAWLGWMGLPLTLLTAAGVGLLVAGVVSGVSKRKFEMSSAIPFGPFLVLGFWTVWCFGNEPQFWLK